MELEKIDMKEPVGHFAKVILVSTDNVTVEFLPFPQWGCYIGVVQVGTYNIALAIPMDSHKNPVVSRVGSIEQWEEGMRDDVEKVFNLKVI